VYTLLFLVSTLYTRRVTELGMRAHLRLILVPLIAGIAMLLASWALRLLLLAHLPRAALLGVEVVGAALAFLGTAQLLGPAVVSDARAVLGELLRPEKTANPGIAS
jgi:hypothetical protein